MDLVIVFRAPFEEAYAIELPIPLIPAIEEIFTTLGLSLFSKCSLQALTI